MIDGWITLHRKIMEWEWYANTPAFRLFIHILLSASYADHKWMGIDIKRGQTVTSRQHISKAIGLTIKQIRLAEAKLEIGKTIVVKGTNKYTIYTIVNYNEYQDDEKIKTNKGQTKDKQRATINKGNKGNKKEYTSDFENWWLAYPRNDCSKLDAWKSYRKATDDGITSDKLLRSVQDYARYHEALKTEKRFIKHAASWLNGKGWEAVYEKPRNKGMDIPTQRPV